MKRTEYKIGEYLYHIPSDEKTEKCYPEGQRVFIHSGYMNGDGYGVVFGWSNGKIYKDHSYRSFMKSGKFRKATEEEIDEFIKAIHHQETIEQY